MNYLKKYTSLLLFIILSAGVTQAQSAQEWTIDKAHASVNFEIDHVFTSVKGNFNKFDGTINFDPENLDESKLTFTVDIGSIDTNVEQRDKHLKSEDFFNAAEYPTMTFVSTEIKEGDEQHEYEAVGNLTIKDVTKEVVIEFEVTGMQAHPMQENTMLAGFEFETEINRTDFHVGVGQWASTGIVGDEVEIFIPMEVTHKTE